MLAARDDTAANVTIENMFTIKNAYCPSFRRTGHGCSRAVVRLQVGCHVDRGASPFRQAVRVERTGRTTLISPERMLR